MVIYAEPNFARLPPDVVRLFDMAGERSFFAQTAWYELVARFARPDEAQFRLYLDAEPASTGFLLRTNGPRALHGVSNAYTMEYGPLGGDAADCAALEQLAQAMAGEDPRREMIVMAALDPKAPSYRALVDGFRSARWAVKPFFDSGTWYEETNGLDFRRYMDMRPSVLRNTMRRKTKAAEAEGAEYVFADTGCDIERLIEDYETVYRNSWKEAEPFARFMPELNSSRVPPWRAAHGHRTSRRNTGGGPVLAHLARPRRHLQARA